MNTAVSLTLVLLSVNHGKSPLPSSWYSFRINVEFCIHFELHITHPLNHRDCSDIIGHPRDCPVQLRGLRGKRPLLPRQLDAERLLPQQVRAREQH